MSTDYDISALPWLHASHELLLNQVRQGSLGHGHLLDVHSQLGGDVLAMSMARLIMCQALTPVGACGQCKACLLVSAGTHPDLHSVAPDGNQIKVDQIRSLCNSLTSTAQQGGKRVAIIYQSERLNTASANALLKTLEEPGKETFVILQTDRPAALLATVKSRCQTLTLTPPNNAEVTAWLKAQQLLPTALDGAKPHDVTWCLSVVGGPIQLAASLQSDKYQTLLNYRKEWALSLRSGHLCGSLLHLKDSQLIDALQVLYLYLRHFVLKSNDINAFTKAQVITLAARIMDMCHKLTTMAAINAQGLCMDYVLAFKKLTHTHR
ncbi:DNA polymerase III subunit delta' [Shewanella sp.]|uniref:DNA polymerase III subunit delta' n=1 Tax=Shewanella sp. TaxID=50422 RepID=UPI004053E744